MRLLLRPSDHSRSLKSRIGVFILCGILVLGSVCAVFRIYPGGGDAPQVEIGGSVPAGGGHSNLLSPWGYHSKRNIPRLSAILAEIRRDATSSFSLVDYGSDQGYFSVSIAHEFPDALVFSVELGGKGGDIYRAIKGEDVIDVQRRMIKRFGVHNVHICRARVHEQYFGKLVGRGVRHRYQLVLSVFHWLPMETRDEFELVLADLLQGAYTTFIELPIMGEDPVLHRQVGAERVRKWYDGRVDVREIILETAKARRINGVQVREIAAVPWLKWKRRVFRVDVGEGGDETTAHYPCKDLQAVLRCEQQQPFC